MFYEKKVNERKPVFLELFVKLSVIPSTNDVAVNALTDRSRRNSKNGTPTWWKSKCSSDTSWETPTYVTTQCRRRGHVTVRSKRARVRIVRNDGAYKRSVSSAVCFMSRDKWQLIRDAPIPHACPRACVPRFIRGKKVISEKYRQNRRKRIICEERRFPL